MVSRLWRQLFQVIGSLKSHRGFKMGDERFVEVGDSVFNVDAIVIAFNRGPSLEIKLAGHGESLFLTGSTKDTV